MGGIYIYIYLRKSMIKSLSKKKVGFNVIGFVMLLLCDVYRDCSKTGDG